MKKEVIVFLLTVLPLPFFCNRHVKLPNIWAKFQVNIPHMKTETDIQKKAKKKIPQLVMNIQCFHYSTKCDFVFSAVQTGATR